MSDYYIGLSGLAAAQQAFDVIGNNIANAATDGYHRQRLELSPAFALQPETTIFVGGVNIKGVTRMIDTLLDQEILRQKSSQAAVSQETSTLSTVESAFGEFSTKDGGLNAAIDTFFNSLQNLSIHPGENIWQNQAVSDAETMAGQFRTTGEFLSTTEDQIKLEAENTAGTINTLVSQIGGLNSQIEKIMLVGGNANSMSDQRDQFMSKLSELIGFQTVERDNGVIDISTGGIPLVTGSSVNPIEVGYTSDGALGISIAGSSNYVANIQGGKIGALLSLHNEVVSGISDKLDSLANAIIQEINNYHVMGTGSAGSFTQLTGRSLTTDKLSDIENISNGTLYIRVTNTSTGEITRHAIAIDADHGTLSSIATAAIPGLTASVNSSGAFTISADTNYKFDFMPCVLPKPTLVHFDDASPPTIAVSGIYTGSENDTFQFTVKGDGAVGNGTLKLEVRNSGGELVKTLNIGSGYAVGDLLDVGNGIKISLSTGNLAESDNDFFSIDAFVNTDTSGFLSATGINTFFSGSSAKNMAVSSAVSQDPRQVATAIGADATDNTNIAQMAAIKDKTISSLGTLTCGEFYQKLVTDIGQDLSVKQTQQDSIDAIVQNLTKRQNDVSGVDINEEAAQLLIFEQMFQAMAKYMSTIDASVASLMQIV
jgi:flagellar hook-associated protein FlgK